MFATAVALSWCPTACRRPRRREQRSPSAMRRSCGWSSSSRSAGPASPTEPIDVDLLFDEPTVSLRGPWNPADLVEIGPSAEDLVDRFEYHLDFPGNALDPGCDYERWERRLSEGTHPAVYAHVASDPGHPGQLALQYWFFYVVQRLEQPARGRLGDDPAPLRRGRRARGARRRSRSRSATASTRAPSAPSGATRSSSSSTAAGRSSTRPPARTPTSSPTRSTSAARPSRASAATTRAGRTSSSDPAVHHDPERPRSGAKPRSRGSRSRAAGASSRRPSSTAPTGPNLKRQWTEPIEWSEGWRTSELRRADGRRASARTRPTSSATAVGTGLAALVRLVRSPRADAHPARRDPRARRSRWPSAATWRPSHPSAWRAGARGVRRSSAAGRMYRTRPRLFLGIGLLFIPLAAVISILQSARLRRVRPARGRHDG